MIQFKYYVDARNFIHWVVSSFISKLRTKWLQRPCAQIRREHILVHSTSSRISFPSSTYLNAFPRSRSSVPHKVPARITRPCLETRVASARSSRPRPSDFLPHEKRRFAAQNQATYLPKPQPSTPMLPHTGLGRESALLSGSSGLGWGKDARECIASLYLPSGYADKANPVAVEA